MNRADMTAEQKKIRNRQNAASRNAYEARTYSKIMLRIRTDGADGFDAEQIRHAAEQSGQSVNAWILDAIRSKL